MKFLVLIAAVLLFGMLFVWDWAERDLPEPPGPPFPEHVIEIGTNDLPIGTHVFVPGPKVYYGEVIGTSGAHPFPDGTTRPGVLLRKHFSETWIPREKMGKMVVNNHPKAP